MNCEKRNGWEGPDEEYDKLMVG